MAQMTEEDREAYAEEQNEYRLAQQYHNQRSNPPSPKAGKIARYMKTAYDDGDTTYDVVWIDRTDGKTVMSYDGADPANTNPYYGATPDSAGFTRKGLDINEMIDPSEQKVSDDQIRRQVYEGTY